MPSDNVVTGLAFVGFGLGLYLFFKGFREYRKYRVLADTPEVPIRSVAMGLVEIHGMASGEHQIFSPVSHTPCFYYKVAIEKWIEDSNRRGSWSHLLTEQGGVCFYLHDETGKVLIDPQGAELDLNQNSRREAGGGLRRGFALTFEGGKKTDPTLGIGPSDPELLSYVESAGRGSFLAQRVPATALSGSAATGPPTGGSSSRQEARAQFDAFLHEFRRRGRAASSGEDLRRFLNFVRRGLGGSIGMVDSGERFRLTEYCIVPDRPYDITGTCTLNPMPQDENDRNMIVKGENEPTFVISWRSEREIESLLRRHAIIYVFGGAALSLLSLKFVLARLGLL